MAEPDNIVLEYLRHICASQDRMEPRIEDLTLRMGHVERATAEHASQLAEVNIKLDRLDAHITRIEKRLDLAEA